MEARTRTALAMTRPLIEGETFAHRGAALSSAREGGDRTPSHATEHRVGVGVGVDVGVCVGAWVLGPAPHFPTEAEGFCVTARPAAGVGTASARSGKGREELSSAEQSRAAGLLAASPQNRRSIQGWPWERHCCGSALRCWRCPERAVSWTRGGAEPTLGKHREKRC